MTICAICQKDRDYVFSLPIPVEGGEEDEFEVKKICGSCWEIVNEISRRVTASLDARVERLEKNLENLLNS